MSAGQLERWAMRAVGVHAPHDEAPLLLWTRAYREAAMRFSAAACVVAVFAVLVALFTVVTA